MRKQLINICGSARSGSTMVDLMIGNDPRAFSLGEIEAWFRPYRTHHFNIICSCGKDNCPWETLKGLKEKDFYKRSFEILDVDFLVDSSKNLPWVIDNNIRSKRTGIIVYNILLFKEPISFFYSFWKRGVPIEQAKRKEFINYYNRFFQAHVPFISLNYNKLVADPARILSELCKLIDIPYFDGKELFWKKEHHHLFGSIGTRKQIEKTTSQIRSSEEYPNEFKASIPKIIKKIENDLEFQAIFKKLEDHELKKIEHLPENIICKPYWYYLSRAKQKLRQQFPKKWDYNQ